MVSMKNPEALAILIAAEGTISLRKNNKNDFVPIICVYNTEQAIVDYAQAMCGGVGKIQKQSRTKWFANARPQLTWIVVKQEDALAIAKAILPFLPTKQEQCRLLIEFVKLRLAVKKGTRWSLPTGTREKEIKERMFILNRKGVN